MEKEFNLKKGLERMRKIDKMPKKEFNLYEKRKFGIGIDEYIYLERDVKEFIKNQLNNLNNLFMESVTINGKLYIPYNKLKRFENDFHKDTGKDLI